MTSAFEHKSTVEEIRTHFDANVERFSNLETGQVAAIDSLVHMDVLTTAAQAVNPGATNVLDLGCGAGNYTLKLLQRFGDTPPERVTLVDLSRPMLDRAVARLAEAVPGVAVEAVQADVRDFDFGESRFDVAMAAQCLHHLRGDDEWEAVFSKIFRGLTPGGSLWIADSLAYHQPQVHRMMWERWGRYLEKIDGPEYRDRFFAKVEKEDTPRPLSWQLDLMRRVGFAGPDVLHVNSRFASFGGTKALPVSSVQNRTAPSTNA